ncbi:hypothetical protein PQR29_04620 [Paraburkholderia strydomiana]|uniref:hypothetical protein n=1 Tax=Paraburkholderia strydomiana TaxID=1245417 RepID=UPI0038BA3440
MKRFAKLNGDKVEVVVETNTPPDAGFIEVPDDTPCGPGYLYQDGAFRPAGAPFGYGVGIGYTS